MTATGPGCAQSGSESHWHPSVVPLGCSSRLGTFRRDRSVARRFHFGDNEIAFSSLNIEPHGRFLVAGVRRNKVCGGQCRRKFRYQRLSCRVVSCCLTNGALARSMALRGMPYSVCLQAVTGKLCRGRLSKDAKRCAGKCHAKRRWVVEIPRPCGREREKSEKANLS